MGKNYFINGETIVKVKGRSDSIIAGLSDLGLTETAIRISVEYLDLEIKVDAYGKGPPESQSMGAYAHANMTFVWFDTDVLDFCVQEAMGASPAFGTLGHAGTLFGNGLPRFSPGINGNHFIGMNVISATGKRPWRFVHSKLAGQPMEWPLGTERSLVSVKWTAYPYSVDPWNNGNGSYGTPIFDFTSDS